MSLLEKATLITTPTAHSNGTLHSIKGGEVADFDVVRGSLATRVNAEGLIEDISVLSGELVTNGDFATDSNWVKQTGWSISGGTANCDGSQNVPESVYQNGVTIVGKTYKITYTLVSVTSGAVRAISGTLGGTNQSTIGTYTEYLTATSNAVIQIQGNPSFIGSIDNVSVKEVIDATNIPRIDYTTGEGVVLLEPQSTNLVPYSEDFSQWAASGNAVVSDDFAISPNGNINASKFTFDGTTNSTVNNTIPVTDGVSYTFSVWLKNNDLSDATKVWIGLSTTTQGEYVTVTNVWKRFVITSTSNGTAEYPRVQTSEVGSIFAWGAQLEALPYATSYIPTSGAIATRLADSVSGAGDATTFNSTEGVLYAEMAALANSGGNRIISLSDGSQAQRVIIFFSSTSNQVRAISANNGNQCDISFIAPNALDYLKVAFKFKQNDFALWVNGTEVGTDTNGITSIGLSELALDNGSGGTNFYGKVKALAVFNEALTDSELECLTTI